VILPLDGWRDASCAAPAYSEPPVHARQYRTPWYVLVVVTRAGDRNCVRVGKFGAIISRVVVEAVSPVGSERRSLSTGGAGFR